MTDIIHDVTIDLLHPRPTVVHVVQDDSIRVIRLTLLEDGLPLVMETTSGETIHGEVAYQSKESRGEYDQIKVGSSYLPAVTKVTGFSGVYLVKIAGAVTACAGNVMLTVRFYKDSGETIHTFPVMLYVDKSAHPLSEPSNDYYNVLALADVQAVITALEADLDALSAQHASDIASINTSLTGINTQVGSLNSSVSTLNTDVATLKQNVTLINTNLGTIGQTLSAYDNRITALDRRVSVLEDDRNLHYCSQKLDIGSVSASAIAPGIIRIGDYLVDANGTFAEVIDIYQGLITYTVVEYGIYTPIQIPYGTEDPIEYLATMDPGLYTAGISATRNFEAKVFGAGSKTCAIVTEMDATTGLTRYFYADETLIGKLSYGLTANSVKLTGLSTPVNGSDAATKAYVDSAVGNGKRLLFSYNKLTDDGVTDASFIGPSGTINAGDYLTDTAGTFAIVTGVDGSTVYYTVDEYGGYKPVTIPSSVVDVPAFLADSPAGLYSASRTPYELFLADVQSVTDGGGAIIRYFNDSGEMTIYFYTGTTLAGKVEFGATAGSTVITGLADPTVSSGAATKSYVDAKIAAAGNVPPSSYVDEGKFLRVDSNGDAAWDDYEVSADVQAKSIEIDSFSQSYEPQYGAVKIETSDTSYSGTAQLNLTATADPVITARHVLVSGLADPVSENDAVTKGYVDARADGVCLIWTSQNSPQGPEAGRYLAINSLSGPVWTTPQVGHIVMAPDSLAQDASALHGWLIVGIDNNSIAMLTRFA